MTAVDASAVGLARARELAAERGVAIETVVADLAAWEGPAEHWAGIVLIFAHFPPEVRARVHRAVAGWLKPWTCCGRTSQGCRSSSLESLIGRWSKGASTPGWARWCSVWAGGA